MTIAYRASSTSIFWNNQNTTQSINRPTGTVAGDLLVLVMVDYPSGPGSGGSIATPSSGWTVSHNLTGTDNSGFPPRFRLLYRIADLSSTDNQTFVPTNFMYGGVMMFGFSGVNTGTPIATDGTPTFNVGSGTITGPALTATRAQMGVTMGVSANGSGLPWTAHNIGTEQFNSCGFYGDLSVVTISGSSGDLGSVTMTPGVVTRDRVVFGLLIDSPPDTVSAVLDGTWGAWTGAAAATVHVPVEATLAASWGAWTGAMAATIPVAPVHEAVLAATWGSWTGAMSAVRKTEAVLAATWGAWTAAAAATKHTPIHATMAATWGGWTAAAAATVHLPIAFGAEWGNWSARAYIRPLTPPRTSALVPYTLGCGVYEAYIKTRGGYTFVGRARNITNLKWSRVLNDVSEAEITFALNGDQGNCCDLAATINPWEHELAIYRDGGEVWAGPVTGGKIDLNDSTATFNAKDLFAWFDHRWVEVRDNDVEFEDTDITEVFLWLLDHGYWKDPFNLDWLMTGERLNVPINRTYVAATAPDRWGGVFQNVATELRDLVAAKIDFTTIRRTLLAGNLQHDSRTNPIQLLDQDWEKLPDINIVGSAMATQQAVAGSNAGFFGYEDDQMWIEKPDDSYREQFGLLQSLDTAAELDDIDTYDSPNPITQRAFELREIRKQPFVYLSGGVMSRHAPITTDQLIPGHHFRVALNQTCRTVRSNYLLTRADFTFDGDAEGIALELVPPGADMLKGAA